MQCGTLENVSNSNGLNKYANRKQFIFVAYPIYVHLCGKIEKYKGNLYFVADSAMT